MQRTCQHCGREATTGRFCRNCGAPLFAENEMTNAATRNYPPNQPSAVPTVPHNAPYTQHDYPSSDTARFYRPPEVSAYATPPRKNTALWVILAIFCMLVMIGGLASAIVWSRIKAQQQARRFEPRIEIPSGRVFIPPPPAAPPAPPALPGRSAVSVEDLLYPNVTNSRRVGALGSETIQLWTKDDFEKVKKFYQERLGPPMKEDSEERKASFMSVGQNKIIIAIKPDKKNDDQLVISIVYAGLPIPNFR